MKGPGEWFTGSVFVDTVVVAEAPARGRGARVTFAPSARTAWHTHPLGQALHVLSGRGWVQTRGEAARAIGPGDSVWFAPGEVHWHGAQADHAMVHLAVQEADENGQVVTWMEHVTDEEYGAARG